MKSMLRKYNKITFGQWKLAMCISATVVLSSSGCANVQPVAGAEADISGKIDDLGHAGSMRDSSLSNKINQSNADIKTHHTKTLNDVQAQVVALQTEIAESRNQSGAKHDGHTQNFVVLDQNINEALKDLSTEIFELRALIQAPKEKKTVHEKAVKAIEKEQKKLIEKLGNTKSPNEKRKTIADIKEISKAIKAVRDEVTTGFPGADKRKSKRDSLPPISDPGFAKEYSKEVIDDYKKAEEKAKRRETELVIEVKEKEYETLFEPILEEMTETSTAIGSEETEDVIDGKVAAFSHVAQEHSVPNGDDGHTFAIKKSEKDQTKYLYEDPSSLLNRLEKELKVDKITNGKFWEENGIKNEAIACFNKRGKKFNGKKDHPNMETLIKRVQESEYFAAIGCDHSTTTRSKMSFGNSGVLNGLVKKEGNKDGAESVFYGKIKKLNDGSGKKGNKNPLGAKKLFLEDSVGSRLLLKTVLSLKDNPNFSIEGFHKEKHSNVFAFRKKEKTIGDPEKFAIHSKIFNEIYQNFKYCYKTEPIFMFDAEGEKIKDIEIKKVFTKAYTSLYTTEKEGLFTKKNKYTPDQALALATKKVTEIFLNEKGKKGNKTITEKLSKAVEEVEKELEKLEITYFIDKNYDKKIEHQLYTDIVTFIDAELEAITGKANEHREVSSPSEKSASKKPSRKNSSEKNSQASHSDAENNQDGEDNKSNGGN